MVWFPSITTAPTTATSTPPTSPLPPTAPTRQSRERCWAVRDAFFDCLNTHGIIDSLKDKDLAAKNCRQEDIDFGRECVGSWVSVPSIPNYYYLAFIFVSLMHLFIWLNLYWV